MKKIFLTAIFITIFIFMLTLCSCTGVSESPAEDFTYEMSDGEIIITGYTGTDLSIRIPSSINDRPVTVIEAEAFKGYDMTDIVIPDSVVEIGNYAFSECNCLTSVKFSKNLETIGEFAFSYCDALTTVSLPETLERVSDGAFNGSGLQTVSLPQNLKYLGKNAFAFCENLAVLEIPNDTEMAIGYTADIINNPGDMGSVMFYWFSSPVGESYTRTYLDSEVDAWAGTDEYEQLHTKLIVSENSYAYEQVKPFLTGYGLTVEVK